MYKLNYKELRNMQIEFELATPNDEKMIGQLIGDVALGGATKITHLFPQGYFAYTKQLGKKFQDVIAKHDEHLLFHLLNVVRDAYVNGKVCPIGHIGNVVSTYGSRNIPRAVYYLMRVVNNNPPLPFYVYLVAHKNPIAASRFLRNGVTYVEPLNMGRVDLIPILLNHSLPNLEGDIRRATSADIPLLVKKLNENKMHFARYYTVEDFTTNSFLKESLNNIYLLFRDNQLKSVMGVADHSDTHVIRIPDYAAEMHQQMQNSGSKNIIHLPPLNGSIKMCHIAFTSCSSIEDFKILLRKIYNDLIEVKQYVYLNISLHERDPHVPLLKDYAYSPISFNLYIANIDPMVPLDDRIPWIEADVII